MDEIIEMYGKMCIALEKIEHCKEFTSLIPEVRTNLVYARKNARGISDVIGVDGRITVIEGMPCAAGRPRFGASSHMARLLLEIRTIEPSVRAGINFANTPELTQWLQDYCRSMRWIFSEIDRSKEPDDIKLEEGASMPWKVREAIRTAGGKVPKLFYETGAVGKEAVSVLVGKDPIEVADEVCKIARVYYDKR